MAGTEILIALAVSAGSSILTSALAPKPRYPPVDKGRHDDIRIQGSEYGTSIPIVYGRARLAGNIIWTDGVQPHVTTTPGRSGGKFGGGSDPEPPTNNYTYTTNLAIAICEGVVKGGLKRIWENTTITLNLDTSPLPISSRYEAESSINMFDMGAEIVRDVNCSSGYKVTLTQDGASLTFHNISVPQIGNHYISIAYTGNGERRAELFVDGISIGEHSFDSTGSDNVVMLKEIQHNFTATGTHNIKIKRIPGHLPPDLDSLAVRAVTSDYVYQPTELTGGVNYDNPYPTDLDYPSNYYNFRVPIEDGTNPGEPFPPGGGVGPGSQTGASSYGQFKFYAGTETQLPDPLIEAIDGVGNVPAYRGTSYIVLRNYQIPDGQLPQFSFEVEEGTHDLADILVDLWDRVGIGSEYLDVTELAGIYVEGLVINSRTELAGILDMLQIAYAFDFIDVDGKIKAIKRGKSSIVTIPKEDLKSHEYGSEAPLAEVENTYTDVTQLPEQIDISYLDREKEYHQNVQHAIKQISASKDPQVINFPLVLHSTEAQRIALRVLYTIHLQRVLHKFTLPPKYSYLTPTDVVTINLDGVSHTLRIVRISLGLTGFLEINAVPEIASLYGQVLTGDSGGGTEAPPIPYPANSKLVLMDIRPLFQSQTETGFYAACCGRGEGNWNGAHLYREEIANSSVYERIGGFEVPATIGVVQNNLSNNPSYNENDFDVTSSITVDMYFGTLESFSENEILTNDGLNLAYIGGELVQFASAVVEPAPAPYVRRYTITKFLRGINATFEEMNSHVTGEDFVYFNNAVKFFREQPGQLYLDKRYKAVTIGQTILGAETVVFQTGDGNAPPPASNLVLTKVEKLSAEGVAFMVIRGTFDFNTYVGGQKAKVFLRRPGETEFVNTGILVTPDANNQGSFEITGITDGVYYIQVVTVSPFDHSLPNYPSDPHPIATITVDSTTSIPITPEAPVATFDGQTVTWILPEPVSADHSYYKITDEFGVVLPNGLRVDGTTFNEYPQAVLKRRVMAVSNRGAQSELSPVGTFTLDLPEPPENYQVIFDGYQLIHTWNNDPAYYYEIADGSFTVLGISRSGQWIETSIPTGRSHIRYIRSTYFGVSSEWTPAGGYIITIDAPPPPDLVIFDVSSATPFDVLLRIEPPEDLDRRNIRQTIVEILKASDGTILYTLPFEGVAEAVNISGRFATESTRTIKARAYYVDFSGSGASASTLLSYTFPVIGSDDVGDNTVRARHLVVGGLSDNLVYNPSFELIGEDGFPEKWTWYSVEGAQAVNVGLGNNKAVLMTQPQGISSEAITVSPGTTVALQIKAWGSPTGATVNAKVLFRTTMPSTGNVRFDRYIGTGGDGLAPLENSLLLGTIVLPTTAESLKEFNFTVPNNCYWMSLVFESELGSAYVDDINMKFQVGDAFITDLKASKVRADVIGAGLVFSDQIKQTNYVPFQNGSVYSLASSSWIFGSGTVLTYTPGSDTLFYPGGINNWGQEAVILSQNWQKVKNGTDGHFEFTIRTKETSSYVLCGFTAASSSITSADNHSLFEYAWYLRENGEAWVYEAGQSIVNLGMHSFGDVFRVSIENEYVRYRKNGKLMYTSPYKTNLTRKGTVTPDFRGAVAFFGDSVTIHTISLTQKGTGQGWRLNPLEGSSLFNQEPIWLHSVGNLSSSDLIDSNALTKNGGLAAWDTSTVSEQEIEFGDGWVQGAPITASASNNSMFGISNDSDWANPSTMKMTHGIYFSGFDVYVVEQGDLIGGAPKTTHSSGDIFRVSIEGGFVKYRKNGSVFYTSTVTTLVYPYRMKVLFHQPGDGLDFLFITASSAGGGEFNSGITVRGKNLDETVELVTESIRLDRRYKGNDTASPSNQITSLTYDSYYAAFDDDVAYVSLSMFIADYKTNKTKNLDSVSHVRVRVYNKFGEVVSRFNDTQFSWNGRGVFYSGYIPRSFSDPKEEAVFSIEIENLYGLSPVIWYSEAAWKSSGGRVWNSAPQGNNLSYSPPQWMLKNNCPKNLTAIVLTTTSVRLTWSPAVNHSSTTHDVYYRLYSPNGYSSSGWTLFSTSTSGSMDVTGLQENKKYEFMISVNGQDDTWSNLAYAKMQASISAPAYAAPIAFSGNSSTAGQIVLTWDNNNGANYSTTEVYYVSGTGVPDENDTLLDDTNTETLTHGSLGSNATYSYRARNVYVNAGTFYSDWTPVVTKTTLSSPSPSTLPTNVHIHGFSPYSVVVEWTSNGGATTHLVQLDYAGGDFSSPIYSLSGTGTSRLVSGLIPSTLYEARVSADGGTNWSSPNGIGSTPPYYEDPQCIDVESVIYKIHIDGTIIKVRAGDVEKHDRLLSFDLTSNQVNVSAVKHVMKSKAVGYYRIVTETGKQVKCTPTHPLINGFGDVHGTPAAKLSIGDKLLVYSAEDFIEDVIKEMEFYSEELMVVTYEMESTERTFVSDGILSHNLRQKTF